jgi:hypothetical protein
MVGKVNRAPGYSLKERGGASACVGVAGGDDGQRSGEQDSRDR